MVRNHIIDTLKGLNWHIELDEFDWNTPIGPRHFVNVIATKDPEASRRLIVSAHFDSKYFPSYPDNQASPALLRLKNGVEKDKSSWVPQTLLHHVQ